MKALRGVIVLVLTLALSAPVLAAEKSRWQKLENNPACAVWNGNPKEQETVTWSGACANGKAQGRGTLVWRFFENGEWKEGRYEGDYKGGWAHGRGVYVGANGNRYEGDWKNSERHGRGVTVWVNGNRYEGDWTDGKAHGRGTFHFANGDECEGDWRASKLLGWGKGWRSSDARWMKCYQDGNTIKLKD